MYKNNGFTILEMSVVLLIVSLLLGSAMMGITAQVDAKRTSDTQKGLADIKDALIGYAIANKHLPCPDKTGGSGAGTANDGMEDFTVATGVCVTQEGNIPWATLGITDVDGWAHRFHYRVTSAFSNRAPSATLLTLSSVGTMKICQTASCTSQLATAVPAVFLSYGPNGLNAITTTGAQITFPPLIPPDIHADERENINQDDIFVSHPRSAAGGALGEFDDLVDWLPTSVLISKMTTAGVPPGP